MKHQEPNPVSLFYHHVVLIATLWGGIATHSSWLIPFVLLQSVTQITIYTDNFIKSLLPNMQTRGAQFVANFKLFQFLFGALLAATIQGLGLESSYASACLGATTSPASLVILGAYELYVMGWMVAIFHGKKKVD